MNLKRLCKMLGSASALCLACAAQAHFQVLYVDDTALQRAAPVELAAVFTHPFSGGPTMAMGKPRLFTASSTNSFEHVGQLVENLNQTDARVTLRLLALVLALSKTQVGPTSIDLILHDVVLDAVGEALPFLAIWQRDFFVCGFVSMAKL